MITSEERAFIKNAYDLTSEQVLDAIKLHKRAPFSLCAAAKIIKNRGARNGKD